MIGHFRSVDPELIRAELCVIQTRAREGWDWSQLEIHDLSIRCLMGRDLSGRTTSLVPIFDAIYYAPDYSWRCGKFDEVKFTGDIDAMEGWLIKRAEVSRLPAVQHYAHNSEGIE